MNAVRLMLFALLFACFSCNTGSRQPAMQAIFKKDAEAYPRRVTGQRVIHVFVALCDNKYQGIVPVPPKIGNGQDPANNLYWGCAFGIKSFFTNSKEWRLEKEVDSKISYPILERCVFKNNETNTWLVADAYDGQLIKTCTDVFLKSCAGNNNDRVILKNGDTIFTGGSANMLAYIGHNGLMDFNLANGYKNIDTLNREAIVMACISKSYFAPLLKQTKAKPVLWSTGLMAPEAYVLHDAISAWVKNQKPEQIRLNSATAYSKYQKFSVKAAKNLLVSE